MHRGEASLKHFLHKPNKSPGRSAFAGGSRSAFDLLKASGYLLSYDKWNILALRNTPERSELGQDEVGSYLERGAIRPPREDL